MGPSWALRPYLCTPPSDITVFSQMIIFPLPSKEKFPQKPCYFGCYAYFVVSRGPLEGPLGFFFIYVSIVNILLLNISQKRPIPRFFINPLRKYKKQVKQQIKQFFSFLRFSRISPFTLNMRAPG